MWNTFFTYAHIFFYHIKHNFRYCMFFAALFILQFSWKWCKFIFYPMYFCLKSQIFQWLPVFVFSCMMYSPFTRDHLVRKRDSNFSKIWHLKSWQFWKRYYCADHILRQSNRILKANRNTKMMIFLYIKHVVVSVECYALCAHSKLGHLQAVTWMEMIHYWMPALLDLNVSIFSVTIRVCLHQVYRICSVILDWLKR